MALSCPDKIAGRAVQKSLINRIRCCDCVGAGAGRRGGGSSSLGMMIGADGSFG